MIQITNLLSKLYLNSERILKIQKIFRGFKVRKINISLKDSISLSLLNKIIDRDNYNLKFVNEINLNLPEKHKYLRKSNFSSESSENIAKFAYFKYTNNMPTWNTKFGDLQVIENNKTIKLEVKGSLDLMDGGPSSFGPTECWDKLLFVDAKNTIKKNYTVYLINLNNSEFGFIKINKNETYQEQCENKRRPRIKFSEIKKQIEDKFKKDIKIIKIFEGHISKLI